MNDQTITPPPPTYAHPRNGYGITALVLALVGLVFGLVPFTGFLALILGALAVLFGLLGWARARRGEATNPKMAVISTALGAVVVALGIWGMTIVFGAVDQLGEDLEGIGQTSTPVSAVDVPSTYSVAASPLPAPSDFTIDIKVLEKKCFGTAGCNVTYQIDPTHTGPQPLTMEKFTVIYEVTGGEDGPQINNFTVTGGESVSYPHEERISTASSGATLKAKATSVSDG